MSTSCSRSGCTFIWTCIGGGCSGKELQSQEETRSGNTRASSIPVLVRPPSKLLSKHSTRHGTTHPAVEVGEALPVVGRPAEALEDGELHEVVHCREERGAHHELRRGAGKGGGWLRRAGHWIAWWTRPRSQPAFPQASSDDPPPQTDSHSHPPTTQPLTRRKMMGIHLIPPFSPPSAPAARRRFLGTYPSIDWSVNASVVC